MREIKFRFWNKKKKVMCYKNEDDSSDYWDGVDCSTVELINNELNSEFTREEYEIMQCTGLKDKNGKEIYEGDIVYVVSEDKNAFVLWNEETTEYIIQFDYSCADFDNYHGKGLEVIGNIYENKDLLERS